VISPEFYTMLFTMHGTIMIFFVIIPLLTGAFGNFLIPLMIGAPDMAFPRLNMFGYWAMLPAIFFALASFAVEGFGPAAGWTAYPPLSTIESAAPGSMTGQTFWLMALTWVGASSMMGAVNYVTTIVKMRAPGMTLMRMPLSIWSLFIAALLQLFALPVLTAASIMQLLDRIVHTGFFTPTNLVINQLSPEGMGAAAGGQPLLWQHLFWFYSHPAVYIMVVPAMGHVSDILSVHARKPIFGYKPMVYSMSAIAGLGII
jgi:cytochrome c oxidase subunit 1